MITSSYDVDDYIELRFWWLKSFTKNSFVVVQRIFMDVRGVSEACQT